MIPITQKAGRKRGFMVLNITEEEFMRMRAIVLDHDRDDALEMIREFVKHLEQAMHSGLKSHLDG
jgi:hypothetical protein